MARWLLGILVLAVVVVFTLVYLRRQSVEFPDAGIPLTLAQERAARIRDLKYEVTFRVPAVRTETIRGEVLATFSLADATKPLAFDFAQPAERVVSVTANAQTLTPLVRNDHLVIPASALVAGENAIRIEFLAGDASLNRQDDFLYALFVPARASLAMPVFDQPDLKARWRLVLNLPPGWTGVANGRQAGSINAPGRSGLIFDETEPIPTYLFTFAAGDFKTEAAERNGRIYHLFHRETDAEKVARNKDAIFDLHASALAWLENYTGIPYPFGKFDFVAIPSFQFGGMEHPGAVFYNATSLFLDENATKNQVLGRASLIAHETAHMWFGDLVTMRWFNDVWMKEVFANFMAAKIVNPSFPDVNHDLRFLLSHYPSAYGVDRTEGANPIRQDLANLHEAGSLYGAIIYQKAPIMMRQLERLIGEDAMRDGLREYLKAHAFGNATWSDLVAVLDAKTPTDLVSWSRAWVEEPGRPTIRTEIETAGGRITRLAFRQEDPRGRGLLWPERLQVEIGGANGVRSFDIALNAQTTEVRDAIGLPAPKWVLPTGGGLGYGYFTLDPMTIESLLTSWPRLPGALTRGAAHVTLWEAMLEGQIAPSRMFEALMDALPGESDELNVADLLGSISAIFWRFTPADDRAALAPRLEALLRNGMTRAGTTSLKAAWFNTLRSVATTPETIAWLGRLWRRDEKIPGLPLAESDEIGLALGLALRDVPDATEMLRTQLERIKNPDRKARFAFVVPSVSADQAVRDRFFESLKDVVNRQREAWVLEALGNLNHPLRAGSSRRYVKPSLELVREIQRTGDIFFPKRWTDAALSGYQSVQTAAEVRAFIDALPPDYPPRLRWVLLSSADNLFRASKLLN
ncbi:MAG TPA: M1 family aminopeptidase [Vicinamibacterales bacterium]|nr:M1 family aminopeptidase [Vicinamibacterales bacterium]